MEVTVKGHPVLSMMDLFLIAKRWQKPEWPLGDEWVNKMWNSHTMKYYSEVETHEVLDRCRSMEGP